MRHDEGAGAGPGGSAPRIPELTPALRALVGVVAAGAAVIAGIGFTGSYRAVQRLAWRQGFGYFSYVFPVGIDAGIVVLLALDLVLTYLRMPLALLRYMAWLLTAATIAFNAAASWPSALPMAMHGVIPLLFVAITEAARHAIARFADLKADRRMEGIRLIRWLVAPWPTFTMWRRMAKWEIRSYERAVEMDRRGVIYRELLAHEYGPGWRRKAPAMERLPLKLARFGELLPALDIPETDLLRKYAPRPRPVPGWELPPAGRTPAAPGPERTAAPTGFPAAGEAWRAPAEPGTPGRDEQAPVPEPLPAPRGGLGTRRPLFQAPPDLGPALGPEPGLPRVPEPVPAGAAPEDWVAWEAEQASRPDRRGARSAGPSRQHRPGPNPAVPERYAPDSGHAEPGGVELGDLPPQAPGTGGGEPDGGVLGAEALDEAALELLRQEQAGEESQDDAPTETWSAMVLAYRGLSHHERTLSATKLGDLLAPRVGLTPATARKYVNRIRREIGG